MRDGTGGYIVRNEYGAFCVVCQSPLSMEEDDWDECDTCGGDGIGMLADSPVAPRRETEDSDLLTTRLEDWVYPILAQGPTAGPTVAQASVALGVPLSRIVEAVEQHYWMFLTGDLSSPETARIDADGE